MLNWQTRKNYLIILLLILIAISGIILTSFITSQWGVGLTSDSAAYIAAARNILNGNGITVLYNDVEQKVPLKLWASSNYNNEPLIFHWPPFYPLVLAITRIFSSDMISGAKFLNILLFGLNILLISLIIKYYTRSIWLTIFSAVIILTSPVMLFIHTNAIPEPLFLLSSFLGLFLLTNYMENRRISFLLTSAFLIGLAFLSRYVGAALIVAGIIGILFLNNQRIRKRIIGSIVFIIISCFPMAVWLARIMVIGGSLTDRSIVFHPIYLSEIKSIPNIITKWLVLVDFPWILSTILLSTILIGVISSVVIINKRNKDNLTLKRIFKIIWLLFVFIFSYLFVLIFSRSFFDARIPVAQDRLLFPVFISSVIIVILFLYSLINFFGSNRIIKVIVYSICVIFTGFYIYNGINWSIDNYNSGQGYAQKYFLQSEIIKEIEKLPQSTIIYTNASDVIYLFTGRASYLFPVKVDPFTLEENKNYSPQTKEMISEVENKGGLIVIFNGVTRDYLPTAKDLKKEFPLCLFSKQSDGFIYEVCPMLKNTILKTDSSNFNNYWRPMNQCKFLSYDQTIKIKISGDDPWFESKFSIKFKNKSPLILKVLMESPIESEFRIFYGKRGELYIFEESDSYPVKKGENEIYFRIPYMEDLEKIRIDPMDAREDCVIKEINIYDT